MAVEAPGAIIFVLACTIVYLYTSAGHVRRLNPEVFRFIIIYEV